jgi:hypothetical protein
MKYVSPSESDILSVYKPYDSFILNIILIGLDWCSMHLLTVVRQKYHPPKQKLAF